MVHRQKAFTIVTGTYAVILCSRFTDPVACRVPMQLHALVQGISQSYIDDTYTQLQFQILPSAAANVTATVSPSTVAQGHNIFIKCTVEGQPSSVAIWILGKNSALKQTVAVKVDGSFSYEIMQDTTNSMYSGQYFVVVQHPGLNGLYDIDWAGARQSTSMIMAEQQCHLFKIYGPGSLQGFDAVAALEQGNQQTVH